MAIINLFHGVLFKESLKARTGLLSETMKKGDVTFTGEKKIGNAFDFHAIEHLTTGWWKVVELL